MIFIHLVNVMNLSIWIYSKWTVHIFLHIHIGSHIFNFQNADATNIKSVWWIMIKATLWTLSFYHIHTYIVQKLHYKYHWIVSYNSTWSWSIWVLYLGLITIIWRINDLYDLKCCCYVTVTLHVEPDVENTRRWSHQLQSTAAPWNTSWFIS